MPQEAFLHKMKYSTDDIAIIVALEEELPEKILPEFNIFYSGVGKINATLKTAEVIYKTNPKLVINYGSAGALNKNLSGLHQVTTFYQRDMDVTDLGFMVGETPLDDINQISLDEKGLSCGTGDSFVSSNQALQTDLVDMEAYAIAKVCLINKLDFMCFKFISDNADAEAGDNWVKNMSLGKNFFRDKILNLFNK